MVLAFLLGGGIWWLVQKNDECSSGEALGELQQKMQVQAEELSRLRLIAGTGQNAVSIERAAQQQLLGRMQGLEAENALLKEELLLFERLIPVSGEVAAVRVESFRVFKESGGRFRYRLLLTFRSDKQTAEFRGRLQFSISYTSSGKTHLLLLPERRESVNDFRVEIKHILRKEGGFELPADAVFQEAEVRVLEGDTLKVRRLAQL